MTAIVFLHIPKTAGQTVHHQLARVVGEDRVSPVRVHTQAGQDAQFPTGYDLYSGHLDWTGLDAVAKDRFVFSILRNPRERIASFYLFLRKQAEALSEAELELPGNKGKRMIRTLSADDYFFSGSHQWEVFIRDHYDNFYCSYFATRKMRGWRDCAALQHRELVSRALEGSRALDRIYSIGELSQLETDIRELTGAEIHVAGNYRNSGPKPETAKRWPQLLSLLERDESARRLEDFAAVDTELMEKIGL